MWIPAKLNRRDWRRRHLRPRIREPSFDRMFAHRARRSVEARQSYWQYGLLLMIGALVAESVVGRA